MTALPHRDYMGKPWLNTSFLIPTYANLPTDSFLTLPVLTNMNEQFPITVKPTEQQKN